MALAALVALCPPASALAQDAAPDASPDASPPSAPPLRAMAGHVVVEREGSDVVRFTEVFMLVVDAEVAARPGELWLRLPDEARAVEVGEGGAFVRAAAQPGLELHGPIPEGRGTLAFTFEVDAPDGQAMVAHALPFEVQGIHVVWPAGAPLSARAMGFTDTGVVEVMGRRMRVLERRSPIALGDRLALITSGEPSSAEPHLRVGAHAEPRTRDPLAPLPPLTLVLAALLVVAGLLLPSSSRLPGRRTRREPDEG